MQQDELDGLPTIFVEQTLIYRINIDDVIQQFKMLTPQRSEEIQGYFCIITCDYMMKNH